MFDYEALRRQQSGQNPDKGLLVTFAYKFDDRKKEEVPYISIFLGKNDTVERPVTEDDKKRFSERWQAFLKNEDSPPEGLPIKQVPFATPSDISSCKSEKIYTVEQLVETPDARLQRAHLLNFKYQCADMLKQLKDSRHIIEMREEIESLKKQLLAMKDRKVELVEEEPDPKPKRGRPRKSDGDDQGTVQPGTA